jgi:O-antigen ligase
MYGGSPTTPGAQKPAPACPPASVTTWSRAWEVTMRNRRLASSPLAAPGAPMALVGADVDRSSRAATSASITSPAERSILLPLREVPGSIFSFEALLLLYMFVGLYKGDPRFAWIPVDPTALFFALSVLVGSFIIVRNPIPRRALPLVFTMLAFVVWWAVTLSWSPSKIYGPTKVFYLATLAFWGLVAGALIVAPDPERIRRLFTLILLLAIWVGIDTLLIYGGNLNEIMLSAQRGREAERFLGSYQHIGRISGLGALVAFTAWLFGRRMSAGNLLLLALCAMLAFVLTSSGGKGPLLATLAAFLLPLVLGLQVTRRKIFYRRYQISMIGLASALTAGLFVYIAATDEVPKSLQRLQGMVDDGALQGTAASRFELYQDALKLWPEAPILGHGAGSWPILTGLPDRLSTPHNMFLEVAVESGAIGLVLVVALLIIGLRPVSVERLRNDPLALCAFMLFAWEFIKANLGPDIAENRVMFLLLGLLTMFTVPSPTAPARAPLPSESSFDLSMARPAGPARGRLGPATRTR